MSVLPCRAAILLRCEGRGPCPANKATTFSCWGFLVKECRISPHNFGQAGISACFSVADCSLPRRAAQSGNKTCTFSNQLARHTSHGIAVCSPNAPSRTHGGPPGGVSYAGILQESSLHQGPLRTGQKRLTLSKLELKRVHGTGNNASRSMNT